MNPRLAVTTATAMTIRAFFADHLRAANEHFDITVLCSDAADYDIASLLPFVDIVDVPFQRDGFGRVDAVTLAKLVKEYRRLKPDIVHSVTPKAGALGMTAARLAGVEHRVHTFTGQVWATRTGAARTVLKTADRLIAANTTTTLVDGHSQQRFLRENGVLAAGKSQVLGAGSISGVDTERFCPDAAARSEIRSSLGLAESDLVFVYLGRIRRDKGVFELLEAFHNVQKGNVGSKLLLVGPSEGAELDGVPMDNVVQVSEFVNDPERYLAAADVFCLPSHREGFGTAVLEAAACGLPSVVSDIYGLEDTVRDGQTGLVVPVENPTELAAAIERLAQDRTLVKSLGDAAQERAATDFDSKDSSALLVDFYRSLLAS